MGVWCGYPFNHIGTELIALQCQFRVISEDGEYGDLRVTDLKMVSETCSK